MTLSLHTCCRSGPIALLVALTLVVQSCTRRARDEDEAEKSPDARVPVKTAPVTRTDVYVTVAATGRTDAVRKEKVFTPVAGKIVSLKALEGSTFREGDVMAVILPKESQAAITGAEALLRSAKTPAQQEEAKRALALAEAGRNQVQLRARFSGTVASRTAAEGEFVAENVELFTLVDLSSLVFMADLPLTSLASVKLGEPAELRLAGLPGRRYYGVVDAVSPQSDPQSQTVKVRLKFRGGDRSLLKTDMAGTAQIVTAVHHHALLIPRPALLRNDENNTYAVVTVASDSLAQNVQVQVGVLTDSTAEITGGRLREGMSVVVEGNYSLADSTKVTTGQPAP